MNNTVPKDKSSFVYFEESGRDLKSTKPLLVFYQMTPELISFKRAQYVHSKKLWLDWEGFIIYEDDFLGWIDPMSLVDL